MANNIQNRHAIRIKNPQLFKVKEFHGHSILSVLAHCIICLMLSFYSILSLLNDNYKLFSQELSQINIIDMASCQESANSEIKYYEEPLFTDISVTVKSFQNEDIAASVAANSPGTLSQQPPTARATRSRQPVDEMSPSASTKTAGAADNGVGAASLIHWYGDHNIVPIYKQRNYSGPTHGNTHYILI